MRLLAIVMTGILALAGLGLLGGCCGGPCSPPDSCGFEPCRWWDSCGGKDGSPIGDPCDCTD